MCADGVKGRVIGTPAMSDYCARNVPRKKGLELTDEELRKIAEVAELHRPHRDTHKPDPSIIHPNWFCCGAMQLGAIGPMDCNHCRTEWPCPTAVALGLNEGEDNE